MDRQESTHAPRSAGAESLRLALERPALGPSDLVPLLRDRRLPGALLERVAVDRRWTAHATVRRALVLHPNLPPTAARTLLPRLFWRELVEVATAPQVDPVLRRQAERRLAGVQDELVLGERIALARIAPRASVAALLAATEEPVLRALLGNPRLVESDAVVLAHRATGSVAAALAMDPRWGGRRDVRLALLRNRRTPAAIAVRLVHALDRREARRVASDPAVPRIARVAAERWARGESPTAGA